MLINLRRVLVVMGLLKLFKGTCFSKTTKLAFQCCLQKLLLEWKEIYNIQSNSQMSFQRIYWYALKVNILEISKEMSRNVFLVLILSRKNLEWEKVKKKTKKKTNPTKTNNAQEKSFDEFLIIHFREWGRKRWNKHT